MKNKDSNVPISNDKAEIFLEPFYSIMEKHLNIKRIRIEGEFTNTIIDRDSNQQIKYKISGTNKQKR